MTYNEYIRNLGSYLDNDDTLVPNIKEEIKKRINVLTKETLFKTIIFIERVKNKIALDMLNEKIIEIITPELQLKNENEYYTEADFIHIFEEGLINATGKESEAKNKYIQNFNSIIQEYETEYLSEKFDSNMLYYRLGKSASNFKCYKRYNKVVLPNYINILTCICAFNKKKLIEIEYKKLIKSVILTLYRCFGYRKSIAESGRALLSKSSSDVKEQKAKIAGIIVCNKDMIKQNICSIKEMVLIKKNTYFFESRYSTIHTISTPLVVTALAITITLALSAVHGIGGGIVTAFPLFVTPVLTIVGSLTGKKIDENYQDYIKKCLKNMEEKSNTKNFFRDYIDEEGIDIKTEVNNDMRCKEGYTGFIQKFQDYTTLVNINYDFHHFKKNIYCQLYILLCKTTVVDETETETEMETKNSTDEVNEKYIKLADELEELYVATKYRNEQSEKYEKFLSKLNELKESLQLSNCVREIKSYSNELQPLIQILKQITTTNYNERIKDVTRFLCQPKYNINGGKRTKKKYIKKLYKRRTWSKK